MKWYVLYYDGGKNVTKNYKISKKQTNNICIVFTLLEAIILYYKIQSICVSFWEYVGPE